MKAYLIARVSTEDQIDAMPAQVSRLLDYARRRDFQYELIEIQESAYKGNREEFRAVLDKIAKAKEKVAVVFDKIDRLTRDSSGEEVRLLNKLCKAGAIELHFPSDNVTIHKDSPATDRMRLGMGIVVAQYYSDSISDNVKRRFEQKLRDGEWIGWAPFGYKNITKPDGKKWVDVEPVEAAAVKLIYESYADSNYPMSRIRERLKEEFGLKIGISQIDLILRNPFYIGEMSVKGELYPHKYERIIDEDVYERVKLKRAGYAVKPRRWAGLPYPYRGLITCSECGCLITFERKLKRQNQVYGHCTQSKGKHGAAYIVEDEFTKQLTGAFKSFHIPDDKYFEVSEMLKQKFEARQQNRDRELAKIDAEIEKYDKRIERVYEDHIDELIPTDLYERKFAEFREKQKLLRKRRKTFEQMAEYSFGTISNLLRLANKAPKIFKDSDFELKRSFLNMALSNIELDGNLLRWKLKKPFKMMAFCSENSNWLRGLDSNQRPSG